MKLYLLRPIGYDESDFEKDYDEYYGFVVRAEGEKEARSLVDDSVASVFEKTPTKWMNSKRTTCVELSPEGEFGVIISDYNAG